MERTETAANPRYAHAIDRCRVRYGVDLTAEHIEAILSAISGGLAIRTGKPGLRQLQSIEWIVRLPSGKPAKCVTTESLDCIITFLPIDKQDDRTVRGKHNGRKGAGHTQPKGGGRLRKGYRRPRGPVRHDDE